MKAATSERAQGTVRHEPAQCPHTHLPRLLRAQSVEVRASSRRARPATGADSAIGKLAAARQQREKRAARRKEEDEEEVGRAFVLMGAGARTAQSAQGQSSACQPEHPACTCVCMLQHCTVSAAHNPAPKRYL